MARETPTVPAPARSLLDLEAEIVSALGRLGGIRARLLVLVGEYDARNGWITAGALSCAHWLAGVADLEVSTAREHVRVARALRSLPRTTARVLDGTLSYAKARQLTRVAGPTTEAELLEVADRVPAGRLGGALGAWLERRDPEAAARHRQEETAMSIRTNPSGTRTLSVTLPAEQMAEIEAAVEHQLRRLPPAERDAPDAPGDASHPPDGDPAARPTDRRLRARALLALLRRAYDPGAPAEAAGPGRGPRVELVLHRRGGETQLPDGTPVPGDVARRLTCDADVRILTHGPDGTPLDLGRRARLVSPGLRRLVEERDGFACSYPGCTATRHLDVHHVVHWEDGGATDLRNLRLLCSGHHQRVHEHGWLA